MLCLPPAALHSQWFCHVEYTASLDRYERAKVADALVDRTFTDGQYVITAGDAKDRNFYILEEVGAFLCLVRCPLSLVLVCASPSRFWPVAALIVGSRFVTGVAVLWALGRAAPPASQCN